MAASPLSSRIPRERVALIERIVRAARGLKGAVDAALLRSYFRGVGEEDLANREPQSLARLAQLHQQFAAGRRRGETRVRVFSPDAALQLGERSSYVLVVTDDRPFLVDSLSLAFSNAGIGVQLLIHPVLEVPRGREGVLRESWQLYEIDRQADPQRLQSLERENSRLQAASLERDELERRLLELRATARRGGPEGASAGAAPAAPQAAPGATGPQVRRQSSLPGGLQRLPQQPTAPVLRPPTDGEY